MYNVDKLLEIVWPNGVVPFDDIRKAFHLKVALEGIFEDIRQRK